MAYRLKFGALTAVALALIAVFLFVSVGSNWGYVLPRRGLKILAIVLTGAAIAFATVVFQTITNNRILTPSIIGLDSMYVLTQTFIIFAYGSSDITVASEQINFLLSVVMMMLFAGLLYNVLLKREGRNIYFLLLVGIVLGTLFGSMSTFMQVLIDPNEYLRLQDRMFASFNNVNTDLLLISIIALLATTAYSTRFMKYLDVLSLGKEQAVSLGVEYDHVVKRLLIIVAILISISTALVGPIMFLGLLVVNVAYQLFNTYRHTFLIWGSIVISVIALVGGQLIVERVFTFATTLSVIINFIGGIYFLYLLLKENKSW